MLPLRWLGGERSAILHAHLEWEHAELDQRMQYFLRAHLAITRAVKLGECCVPLLCTWSVWRCVEHPGHARLESTPHAEHRISDLPSALCRRGGLPARRAEPSPKVDGHQQGRDDAHGGVEQDEHREQCALQATLRARARHRAPLVEGALECLAAATRRKSRTPLHAGCTLLAAALVRLPCV